MNYSYFREPVLQYFALRNWSSDQFLQKVMEGLHNYGFYNLSLMMNLLDSHDTYRFLEACNGNLSQLKLALMFQISWPGIPHLYYGDEVGMMGGSDPDNRRPMNWNFPENKDLSELRIFVQKLISIRKTNNCLIYGDLRICHDDDLIVIERQLENENIVIVLNNSDQEKSLKLEAPYQNLVTKEFINSISLPAYSGIIIRKQ
jgi:glycosidase